MNAPDRPILPHLHGHPFPARPSLRARTAREGATALRGVAGALALDEIRGPRRGVRQIEPTLESKDEKDPENPWKTRAGDPAGNPRLMNVPVFGSRGTTFFAP